MEEFIERSADGSVDFEAALRRAVAVVSRLRAENLALRAPPPEPAPQRCQDRATRALARTAEPAAPRGERSAAAGDSPSSVAPRRGSLGSRRAARRRSDRARAGAEPPDRALAAARAAAARRGRGAAGAARCPARPPAGRRAPGGRGGRRRGGSKLSALALDVPAQQAGPPVGAGAAAGRRRRRLGPPPRAALAAAADDGAPKAMVVDPRRRQRDRRPARRGRARRLRPRRRRRRVAIGGRAGRVGSVSLAATSHEPHRRIRAMRSPTTPAATATPPAAALVRRARRPRWQRPPVRAVRARRAARAPARACSSSRSGSGDAAAAAALSPAPARIDVTRCCARARSTTACGHDVHGGALRRRRARCTLERRRLASPRADDGDELGCVPRPAGHVDQTLYRADERAARRGAAAQHRHAAGRGARERRLRCGLGTRSGGDRRDVGAARGLGRCSQLRRRAPRRSAASPSRRSPRSARPTASSSSRATAWESSSRRHDEAEAPPSPPSGVGATNQAVLDIAARFDNPVEACHAVVARAYGLDRAQPPDDIAIICIFPTTDRPRRCALPSPVRGGAARARHCG